MKKKMMGGATAPGEKRSNPGTKAVVKNTLKAKLGSAVSDSSYKKGGSVKKKKGSAC